MEQSVGLFVTVFTFSVVQSLFGVGLLVFGTPTLLLLGYTFEATIALLLPCSLSISLMQTWAGRRHLSEMRSSILIYCVPMIVVGLTLVLSKLAAFDVKLLVGLALVFSAGTRYYQRLHRALAGLLAKYTKLYLVFMGFIHGISNMGGGFLTIFVTTVHDDKEHIRANIAYGYLVFALSQIAVLFVLRPQVFNVAGLSLIAIAALTYLTAGRFVYLRSTRAVYQHLITAFMVAYGFVLIGQKLL